MACSNEVGKRLVVAVAAGRIIAAVLGEEAGGWYGYGEWLLGRMAG
jgi:hypothetical protein